MTPKEILQGFLRTKISPALADKPGYPRTDSIVEYQAEKLLEHWQDIVRGRAKVYMCYQWPFGQVGLPVHSKETGEVLTIIHECNFNHGLFIADTPKLQAEVEADLLYGEDILLLEIPPNIIKEINAQLGRGEGEGKEAPPIGGMKANTARLKIIIGDKEAVIGLKKSLILNRQVIFDEISYSLPNMPLKYLYALAKKPKELVLYDVFTEMIKGIGSTKTISKHIKTITDRIPPLKPFIKNEPNSGYYLNLPTEDVKVQGVIADVEKSMR